MIGPTAAASPRVRFSRGMAQHGSALRLYAILDAESCRRLGLDLFATAAAMFAGGIRLLQYRDKLASETEYLQTAQSLRRLLPDETLFLLNDYPHLAAAADADGVHIGQHDSPAEAAREHIGPDRILGISTHSADQALTAGTTEADYLAIGPVFATRTKADADPAVGLCGVKAARAVTTKPLVAIGGIGLDNARAIQRTGADSVAIISALLPGSDPVMVTARAQDFLARLK